MKATTIDSNKPHGVSSPKHRELAPLAIFVTKITRKGNNTIFEISNSIKTTQISFPQLISDEHINLYVEQRQERFNNILNKIGTKDLTK